MGQHVSPLHALAAHVILTTACKVSERRYHSPLTHANPLFPLLPSPHAQPAARGVAAGHVSANEMRASGVVSCPGEKSTKSFVLQSPSSFRRLATCWRKLQSSRALQGE